MPFRIEYFHERVLAKIESWPVDVVADYARLIELLMEHGVDLRLPHTAGHSAADCLSCDLAGKVVSAEHFIAS